MKQKVTLEKIGKRTKAVHGEMVLKVIPKPFIQLVKELGFLDIRTDKKTLNQEERLLLVLYKKSEKIKDIPNYSGLENIEILNKNSVITRSGDEYFSVSIKNGPEIKIKHSEWNKLNCEDKEVKRWV